MERVTHAMRREKWKQIIQECNNSGMRKKDWLALNHVQEKAYYRWQKILRVETESEIILSNSTDPVLTQPSFVQLQPPSAISEDKPVIIRTDELSIEVTEDISDSFLLRIIKAISNA
jgi:hypothetical protein